MKKNYTLKPQPYHIYLEGLDHYMDRELKAVGRDLKKSLDTLDDQYKSEFKGTTVPTDEAARDILISEATAYLNAVEEIKTQMELIIYHTNQIYGLSHKAEKNKETKKTA